MAKAKGSKKTGGRIKGVANKRTIQWETFAEYCMTGGLEKFRTELESLQGMAYVNAFITLLEFHKPKLARTEMTGKDGAPISSPTINILPMGEHLPLAKSESEIDKKRNGKES